MCNFEIWSPSICRFLSAFRNDIIATLFGICTQILMLSIWKSHPLYPQYLLLIFFVHYQLLSLAWGRGHSPYIFRQAVACFCCACFKNICASTRKKPLMARPNWELLVLLVLQLLLVLLCLFVGHPSTFPHCRTVTIRGPGTGWRSRVSFFPSCLSRLYLHLIVVLKIHQARTASSLYLWPPPFIFSLYVFCRVL